MHGYQCKYSILVELPDWYKCPCNCQHYGKSYCPITTQTLFIEQLKFDLKGGEKMNEICEVTKANLNNLKGLDVTKVKVRQKINDLALNDEGLRTVLSQTFRLQDFLKVVEDAVKEHVRERAVRSGIGEEPLVIETPNGNITVTPRESVVLLETRATEILESKGLVRECSEIKLSLEKIRKLKKANVITEKEWLEMTVKGEPVLAVSIK